MAGKKPRKIFTILWQYVPALPFLALVGMFEIVPLLGMVIRSFTKEYGHGFTLNNYVAELFGRTAYMSSIKATLQLSIVSSIIGIAVVFITAGLISSARNKIKRFYMTLLTVTSNFWGIPLAFAFISVLGVSGVLVLTGKAVGFGPLATFDLYTMRGLLLLYIYFQIPMGTLLMLPAFEAIRPEWKESAQLLQASPFQFWIKVGIPVMIPSITGTFSMLFANAVTAYATPAMLVANAPLMGVNIASIFVGDNRPKPNLGSAYSVVMLIIIFSVLFLSNLVNRLWVKGGKN